MNNNTFTMTQKLSSSGTAHYNNTVENSTKLIHGIHVFVMYLHLLVGFNFVLVAQ